MNEQVVWKRKQALYGRRPAGAGFRDYLEKVLVGLDGFAFKRGVAEPTAFRDTLSGAIVTHDIDDGRAVTPARLGANLFAGLSRHLVMKVTAAIRPGEGAEHLGRLTVRLAKGVGDKT